MSDSPPKPWSDNPNAPQIPTLVYREEKTLFPGIFLAVMSYGIVVILFFQCIVALINNVNRTRGTIKWPLVAYVVAMFSILTVYTAINLDIQSAGYVDNREFPGEDGLLSPGPLGYQDFVYSQAINVAPAVMFLLNTWLADGLLLYRCYIVYSMSCWIIAFPCLMYLASLAVGIVFVYRGSRPIGILRIRASIAHYEIPYYSISIALNVLLTLMIVTRLFLLNRNLRKAMNAPVRINGLYRAIVTSLVESCALYSVAFLLFIGTWAAGSPVWGTFSPSLPEIQVIATFLIIIRVANRSTSPNITIISGDISSIHFGSQGGLTSGDGVPPDGCPATSMDACKKIPAEAGIVIETAVDLHCRD